jgi:1-acyl-sn-glycerol-3-phosphate acyltransferase
LAWWALDFPFMKRYGKEFLAKHPELKGKDLETTRKACEKFKHTPVSIMNFLEGTRFTPTQTQAPRVTLQASYSSLNQQAWLTHLIL